VQITASGLARSHQGNIVAREVPAIDGPGEEFHISRDPASTAPHQACPRIAFL
jgi:hypothetical protein